MCDFLGYSQDIYYDSACAPENLEYRHLGQSEAFPPYLLATTAFSETNAKSLIPYAVRMTAGEPPKKPSDQGKKDGRCPIELQAKTYDADNASDTGTLSDCELSDLQPVNAAQAREAISSESQEVRAKTA